MIRASRAGWARMIRRLRWAPPESTWSGYAACTTYTSGDASRKADFVREALASHPAGLVWDLGCNTGDYSRIVAEHARCVVAMDADHLAVERLYESLKRTSNASGRQVILPLVANL